MNKRNSDLSKGSKKIPGINPRKKIFLQNPRTFMKPGIHYTEEMLQQMEENERRVLEFREKRKQRDENLLLSKKNEEAVSVTS